MFKLAFGLVQTWPANDLTSEIHASKLQFDLQQIEQVMYPLKGKHTKRCGKPLGKFESLGNDLQILGKHTTSLPGEAPIESILDSELGEFYG